MRDFNFFSPYIEVKKGSKFKWINTLIAIFAIILLLSGITTWNMLRITIGGKDILHTQVCWML